MTQYAPQNLDARKSLTQIKTLITELGNEDLLDLSDISKGRSKADCAVCLRRDGSTQNQSLNNQQTSQPIVADTAGISPVPVTRGSSEKLPQGLHRCS